jgi:hypothetical protein
MSIRSRRSIVRIAEADVALHRAGIIAAWRGFKSEAERAATPGRVIGAGLIAGFVSGLGSPPTANIVSPLRDRVFAMLVDTAFAGFGAAIAAGAAAAEAHDAPAAADARAADPADTRAASARTSPADVD